MTIKKLVIVHQLLPILNVQFLHLLLTSFNTLKEERGRGASFELQIFNLNISAVNLPQVRSQPLLEAYETAFAYEIGQMAQEAAAKGESKEGGGPAHGFNLHLLIDFLAKNPHFVQHGFFQQFGDLLYNLIVSDSRAHSETWLVSVLLKLSTLGVSDPAFLARVESLLDQHAERLASHALVKFVILLASFSKTPP